MHQSNASEAHRHGLSERKLAVKPPHSIHQTSFSLKVAVPAITILSERNLSDHVAVGSSSACSTQRASVMSDDDVAQALQLAEQEVARIEAEVMGSATVAVAAAAPLSLASLSVQCKSMALTDAVNIGLSARNAPTAWAQSEACATNLAAFASKMPPPPNLDPHRNAMSAPAAAKVGSRFSNSWKRSLLAAAAATGPPLAAAWSDAISSGSAAESLDCDVSVPSSLLRFLPLIDARFAEYETHDVAVLFSRYRLQVRFCDCTVQTCTPQPCYSACRHL
jgi:hypothetical protein